MGDAYTDRKGRVLLVDDQISVREMVAMVLDREGRFATVAEAGSGIEALRLFRRAKPDLVIAGLGLPEMNGAELIRTMRDEIPHARLLVYSGSRNRELLAAGLNARPHGFVHKTEPLAVLRQAIVAVGGGHSFFGPFATRMMDEKVRGGGQRPSPLTSKERTILQMVAEGLTTKEVAGRLQIGQRTVESHRSNIMQKLGLRDIASLTRYAVRCGMVEE